MYLLCKNSSDNYVIILSRMYNEEIVYAEFEASFVIVETEGFKNRSKVN